MHTTIQKHKPHPSKVVYSFDCKRLRCKMHNPKCYIGCMSTRFFHRFSVYLQQSAIAKCYIQMGSKFLIKEPWYCYLILLFQTRMFMYFLTMVQNSFDFVSIKIKFPKKFMLNNVLGFSILIIVPTSLPSISKHPIQRIYGAFQLKWHIIWIVRDSQNEYSVFIFATSKMYYSLNNIEQEVLNNQSCCIAQILVDPV